MCYLYKRSKIDYNKTHVAAGGSIIRRCDMAKKVETIGVLTSGGDAPGMNAAIRAVVRKAL
jgi:hypothetical protein